MKTEVIDPVLLADVRREVLHRACNLIAHIPTPEMVISGSKDYNNGFQVGLLVVGDTTTRKNMIYHFTLKGKTVSDPDIKERYVPLRPIPACVSAKDFDECAKAAIYQWKIAVPEQLRGALKIHFNATIGVVQ